MKKMVIFMAFMLTIATINAAEVSSKASSLQKVGGWRIAWLSKREGAEKALQLAHELNFNAVVVYWDKSKTPKFIEQAKTYNLATYTWLFPLFPDGNKKKYQQQMTPAEDVILIAERKLGKQKTLFFSGYQGGGEPLPGNREVMLYDTPCFHHPEVVALLKAKVKEILTSAPNLKGLALDMFGYQNYHCCYCPTSMQAFADYCAKHPKLPKFKAWQKFNLESLISFQNDLCDYARSIRPTVKLSNHVWPVYLPQPLYGNQLNVDYCAQTVAWFFKPFWQDKKIISYTKIVIDKAPQYHKNQQGIPFLGYFNRPDQPLKSPERIAHELELIFANSPENEKNLAIYNFTELIKSPKTIKAMKAVFRKYHIIEAN